MHFINLKRRSLISYSVLAISLVVYLEYLTSVQGIMKISANSSIHNSSFVSQLFNVTRALKSKILDRRSVGETKITPIDNNATGSLPQASFLKSLFAHASDDSMAVVMPSKNNEADDDENSGESVSQDETVPEEEQTGDESGLHNSAIPLNGQQFINVPTKLVARDSQSIRLTSHQLSGLLNDQDGPYDIVEREKAGEAIVGEEGTRVAAASDISGYPGHEGFGSSPHHYSGNSDDGYSSGLHSAASGAYDGSQFNHRFGEQFDAGIQSGQLDQQGNEFNEYRHESSHLGGGYSPGYGGGSNEIGQSGLLRAGSDFQSAGHSGYDAGGSNEWSGANYGHNDFQAYSAGMQQRMFNGIHPNGFSANNAMNDHSFAARSSQYGPQYGYGQNMGRSSQVSPKSWDNQNYAASEYDQPRNFNSRASAEDEFDDDPKLKPLSPTIPYPELGPNFRPEASSISDSATLSSEKFGQKSRGLFSLGYEHKAQMPAGDLSPNKEDNEDNDSGEDRAAARKVDTADSPPTDDFRSIQLTSPNSNSGPIIEFARIGSAGYLQPSRWDEDKNETPKVNGHAGVNNPRHLLSYNSLSSDGRLNPAHAGKFFVE